MKLLTVDSLEEARDKLVKVIGDKWYSTEKIQINNALGRVLANNQKAPMMVPEFRRSTVDGYAVHANDTWGASENAPVFLKIIGEVRIGVWTKQKLHSGECIYIPTGGMLPEGAQSVIMTEFCELFDQDNIVIYESIAVGKNVVEVGEDIANEEIFLKKGTQIEPRHIATLAAVGINEVCVFKPLTITIISTGDELISLGEKREKAKIYDINTYGLSALAVKHGFKVIDAYIIRDHELLLFKGVENAMKISDIVIISGGSSQGKKDMTREVLDKVAFPGVFTHGLSLKPGKPTILGYDMKSDTLLVGLPGHPVAAMIVFELLILWLNRYRLNMEEDYIIPAIMETNFASSPGKTTCQLVELIKSNNGYIAKPIFGKSSLITTLSRAIGYILIDKNKEGIEKGDQVNVYLM